jgi:hypothetical protein
MPPSQKIYGMALRAYPSAFRQRYGVEMARVFDERFRDAQKAGYRSTFRYCVKVVCDLLVTAAGERLMASETSSILVAFVAVVCGCGAAYVDFHASEVQATLLVLLVSSFALGCIKPRRAWLSALIMAALLPGVHVTVFAFRSSETSQGHPYLSRLMMLLPALVASFVGACLGVFLRFIAHQVSQWIEGSNGPGPTIA